MILYRLTLIVIEDDRISLELLATVVVSHYNKLTKFQVIFKFKST